MSVIQKVQVPRFVEERKLGWFGWSTRMVQDGFDEVEVFVPEYEEHFVTSAVDGKKFPLNEKYFATQETAEVVMKKLNGSFIFEKASGSDGGLFVVDGKERWIMFPVVTKTNGTVIPSVQINAGLLADNWTRNKDHQDVALKMAQLAVATAQSN